MELAPPTCTARCDRTCLLLDWRECGRWVVKGLRNLVMGEAGQNKGRYTIVLLGLVAVLIGVLVLSGVISFADVARWLNRTEALLRGR